MGHLLDLVVTVVTSSHGPTQFGTFGKELSVWCSGTGLFSKRSKDKRTSNLYPDLRNLIHSSLEPVIYLPFRVLLRYDGLIIFSFSSLKCGGSTTSPSTLKVN